MKSEPSEFAALIGIGWADRKQVLGALALLVPNVPATNLRRVRNPNHYSFLLGQSQIGDNYFCRQAYNCRERKPGTTAARHNLPEREVDKCKRNLSSSSFCSSGISRWQLVTFNRFATRNTREYSIKLRLGRPRSTFSQVFLGHHAASFSAAAELIS